MQKRVLHLTAEPEPQAFHDTAYAHAFGVTVAPEYLAEDPLSEAQEAEAAAYLDRALPKLKSAKLYLYKVTNSAPPFTLTLEGQVDEVMSGPGGPMVSDFAAWIVEKNKALADIEARQHPYATAPMDDVTPDGAEASVGQILRASQMLEAPVPQRLGLARIARLDSFEPGPDPWHVFLIFAEDVTQPDTLEAVARSDDNGGALFRIETGYMPFDDMTEVAVETNALRALPTDLGLIDPDTGFLKVEVQDLALWTALKRFEDTAASQLWPLPRLLAAAEEVPRGDTLKTEAAAPSWRRWLALAGCVSAFDPILHALSPAEAEGQAKSDIRTEGQILSAIVEPAAELYRQAVEVYNKEFPATPLPLRLAAIIEHVPATLLTLAAERVAEVKPGGAADPIGLLEALGDADALRPLKDALAGAGGPPDGYKHEEPAVVQALSALMSLLQEESGAETVIKALLGPLFHSASVPPRSRFSKELIDAIETGEAIGESERVLLGKVVAQLWLRAEAHFETRFNGAEAVRRTTGEAWLKALTDDARGPNNDKPLSLMRCRGALVDDTGFAKADPPLYAYRYRIADGSADTRRLAVMATRFWTPDDHLPDQAVLDLLFKVPPGAQNDLGTQQVAQVGAMFGIVEPAAENLRLMQPDPVPAPLPLRIADDISGEDLAEFQRVFDGFGVLVQRQTGDTAEPWQHASAIELGIFAGVDAKTAPKYTALPDLAIRPTNPMPVDGRMTLFLDYHGLPLSGAAFDSAVSSDTAPAAPVKTAFSAFTAAADPRTDSGVRLPGLSYGSVMRAAAFGVTKTGSLPKSLQAGKPWLPGPTSVPDGSKLEVSYQRRTAIGRVALDVAAISDLSGLAVNGPADLKRALAGCQALSDDYPRVAASAMEGGTGRLDLFRNTDGRGALLGKDGPSRDLTLKDLQAWGGSVHLSLAFHVLDCRKGGLVTERAAHDALLLSVAPHGPFLDLVVKIAADGTIEAEYGGQTASQQIDPGALAEPHWLRLSVAAANPRDSVALSLGAPDGNDAGAPEKVEFYARPDLTAATLVVPAPGDGGRRDWKPGVPAQYDYAVSFPRVTFADFDRWTENTGLRKGLWGLDDTLADRTVEEILAAYVYRHTAYEGGRPEDAPLKDHVDRLPDPAVSFLVLDLIPQDTLTGETLAPKRLAIPAGKLLSLTKSDIPAPGRDKLRHYEEFLKKIDAAFTLNLTVSGVDKGAPDLKSSGSGSRRIEVTLPKGVAARLLIRPAVPAAHFEATAGQVAAFDAGLRPHHRDVFASGGVEHLIFAGAEAVFEAMLADLDDHDNNLREIVRNTIVCDAGGAERGYALRIVEPATERDRRIWRRLARLDILTQRWRFSGRPIYNWPDPGKLAQPGNPVVPLPRAFVIRDPAYKIHDPVYEHFEEEAFFDRADSDADRVSVRLEPIMLRDPVVVDGRPEYGQEVLRVDWSAPTATLFRHRFEMASRYAGAMLGQSRPVVTSWDAPENTARVQAIKHPTEERLDTWTSRVAMLADRARVALNRPQIRALLPLTQAPHDAEAATGDVVSPPILAVLEDRPLAQGGLAERMVGEIRTGVHFGFLSTSTSVEPVDLRKEFGPDPRIELVPTDASEARRLTLEQEGPVGLTFDSRNIAAPAFPNCQHMFRPVRLDADGRGLGYWQEHAMGLSLRRVLDPGWTVRDGNDEATDRLDLNRGWRYDFPDVGSLTAHGVTVLRIVRDGDGPREVKVLNTAVYETGQGENPLPLCLIPEGPISILHQPLADGSYMSSVLYAPVADDPEKRLSQGLDNAPRLLGSIAWSIPPNAVATPEPRGLQAVGATSVVPASASLATETEWITQARDAAAVHLTGADGLPDETPTPVSKLRAAVTDGPGVTVYRVDDAKPHPVWVPVWVQPRLGEARIPKSVHRHLAVIGTTWSTGLGRRYEVFASKVMATGCLIALDAEAPLPDRLRFVEFETPALPVCANHGDSVPPRYRSAYFDLVATGGTEAAHYRFLLRPVRGPTDLVTNLVLSVATDNPDNDTSLVLELNETGPEDRAAFVEMNWTMEDSDAKVTARKLLADGTAVNLQLPVPRIDVQRTPGIRLKKIVTDGQGGHLWFDISVLHRAKAGTAFDFDWVFGNNHRDETASSGTQPDALAALKEAQARIVAVSPALELNRSG